MNNIQRLQLIKQAVYSWVPEADLDSVQNYGLLSSIAALDNPEVLKRIAKHRGVTPEELKEQIKEDEADAFTPRLRGPNALFQLPPETLQLPDHHPAVKTKGKPVKIDLDKLLKDLPDTKIHGLELIPYSEEDYEKYGDDYPDIRHRDLTQDELSALLSQKPEELWKHYDPESPLYAADVPHMVIQTPKGYIDPKYLQL